MLARARQADEGPARMTKVRELLVEPRSVPVYSIVDAARYLQVPSSTLKAWVLGREFPTSRGTSFTQPLIRVPPGQKRPIQLSFYNLVEAHVLAAMRRVHELPMPKIKRALALVERELGSKQPLIQARFETNGADLLIRSYAGSIQTQDGQLLLEQLGLSYSRIEWDAQDRLAAQLFPYVRADAVRIQEQPKSVVIDPRRAFGRPVLAGTGISTESVAQRHLAGESIDVLARDYELDVEQVEDALRCELLRAAA
jgi:uncharacterized protein (DUF433 family)